MLLEENKHDPMKAVMVNSDYEFLFSPLETAVGEKWDSVIEAIVKFVEGLDDESGGEVKSMLATNLVSCDPGFPYFYEKCIKGKSLERAAVFSGIIGEKQGWDVIFEESLSCGVGELAELKLLESDYKSHSTGDSESDFSRRLSDVMSKTPSTAFTLAIFVNAIFAKPNGVNLWNKVTNGGTTSVQDMSSSAITAVKDQSVSLSRLGELNQDVVLVSDLLGVSLKSTYGKIITSQNLKLFRD